MNDRTLTFTPRHYYQKLGTLLDAHPYRQGASHNWYDGWFKNTGDGVLYIAMMGDGNTIPANETPATSVVPAGDQIFSVLDLDSVFIRTADVGSIDAEA